MQSPLIEYIAVDIQLQYFRAKAYRPNDLQRVQCEAIYILISREGLYRLRKLHDLNLNAAWCMSVL